MLNMLQQHIIPEGIYSRTVMLMIDGGLIYLDEIKKCTFISQRLTPDILLLECSESNNSARDNRGEIKALYYMHMVFVTLNGDNINHIVTITAYDFLSLEASEKKLMYIINRFNTGYSWI